MNNKNNIQHPKDVSRFTRWVNDLDDKDKKLDPLKRKSKWILITAFLFALFAISFIWIPSGKIKSQKVEAPLAGPLTNAPTNAGHSAFELPVDSFENQLKHYIDEGISDKK
ncbi:hypothetical protein [uncultured Draconibacterium sp.]|uniref:hypothetical protein n=1 Tax=uncultured Draconibacterium sp. TaxID=1573823 RepID=UPI0029C84585|nr:hypothetical protein [uncultured Draconibacterium sp.]